MSKWIRFHDQGVPFGRVTRIWYVATTDGASHLGVIQWFARWRCYAFFPSASTVFEKQCLRDIADFCDLKTKTHRAEL